LPIFESFLIPTFTNKNNLPKGFMTEGSVGMTNEEKLIKYYGVPIFKDGLIYENYEKMIVEATDNEKEVTVDKVKIMPH